MTHLIGAERVKEFVETLFADDLHAKRVLSVAHATTGILRAGALGIHAIGRGVALARNTTPKHAVKQTDRLVGNAGINVWELFASWVPYVVGNRTKITVALDWTDYAADEQQTLAASLVTSHGRCTPLVWLTGRSALINGDRLSFEKKLLERLRETLPKAVTRILIVLDRGFADPERWRTMSGLGFDFVSRIKGPTHVTNASGETKGARNWVSASGRALKLDDVTVTGQKFPLPCFVAVHEKGMKEPWLLVSTVKTLSAKELIVLYGRRFTIEESFRDIKDLRFGMGLSARRVSSPDRRDRLLLLSALAIALLTLLGAAGEAVGLDRHFKTNTMKKRQFSLFRQGCDYYEFLPGMRSEWAEPLLAKFSQFLDAEPALAQAVGVL